MSSPFLDHLVEAVEDGLVIIGQGRQPGRGEQPLRHAALRHQAHADLVDQPLRVDGKVQYQHKKNNRTWQYIQNIENFRSVEPIFF
jgi:hypothetical protein